MKNTEKFLGDEEGTLTAAGRMTFKLSDQTDGSGRDTSWVNGQWLMGETGRNPSVN